MKKRKIALIAASWDGETLAATINGIKDRLVDSGMDLYVFLCFPAFGLDSPDNISQFNIFSLPHSLRLHRLSMPDEPVGPCIARTHF